MMYIQETMKNLFRTGLFAVFLLTAVPICMDAQNLKENRRKAEIIQMDKDYYSAFGTGKGKCCPTGVDEPDFLYSRECLCMELD